ncbi:hypothetical protein D3C71_1491450 [compost metagenome]
MNSMVTGWLGLSMRTSLAPESSLACACSASDHAWPTRPCTWLASQLAGGGGAAAVPGSGVAAAVAACWALSSASSCSSGAGPAHAPSASTSESAAIRAAGRRKIDGSCIETPEHEMTLEAYRL